MVVLYLPLRAVCAVPAGKAGAVMGRVTSSVEQGVLSS